MADRKKVREIVGYTQGKMSKDANAWHASAQSFHQATTLLNEFADRIPSDSRPFAFNAALSIELILKAILARKCIDIPNQHDLLMLSDLAVVSLDENQRKTLELLTATIVWSGKYPAPKKESDWDKYHDSTFERHVVRRKIGNVFSAIANPETFPNWSNYSKIWNLCTSEYEAALSKISKNLD